MKSLLPERPLLVYPSLAATIGLEEATLLSALDNLAHTQPQQSHQGFQWRQISEQLLTIQLPFWDVLDIERISQRLRDLGLILLRSAPLNQSGVIDFAFNQQHQSSAEALSQLSMPQRQASGSDTAIAANWRPF